MSSLLITSRNREEQIFLHKSRLAGKELYGTAGCLANETPYGCKAGVVPASFQFPRIPRERWREAIREGIGSFLHDHCKGILPPHDQGRTNYCWGHGSVRTVETLRVFYHQAPILLSAESICVPITHGQNRGGSPEKALDRLMSYGACEQKYWPRNELDVIEAVEGWQENAKENVIIKFCEIENFDDQMTLALRRIPVAIGLGWWGHLVCQLDPVYLDDVPELDEFERPSGGFGVGFDNSWGPSYGDNGYGYLDEEHATATLGAFAPLVVSFHA